LQKDPGDAQKTWGRAGKPDADEGIIFDNIQDDSHVDRPTGNAAFARMRQKMMTLGLTPER
jgi:hypothetical protein